MDKIFQIGLLIVISLLFVLTLCCLLALIRNNQVYIYRTKILQDITFKTQEDVNNNTYNKEDPLWRYKEYDKVSYDDMCRKFWKPLDSFYPKEITK